MKRFLVHIFKTIGETIVFYIEKYRVLYAIRKANRMHTLTGKRYWVLKLLGKYRVYSSQDIKDLKVLKVFSKEVDFIELKKWAVYNTEERNRK